MVLDEVKGERNMLYAICVCVDNGWSIYQEILKKNNIKIGDKFEVEDVSMG